MKFAHPLMFAAGAACALLAGAAAWRATAPRPPTANPEELKFLRPGIVQGYLPRETLIDSLALLPPPPAAGSPEQAADDDAHKISAVSIDTPRWKLAARDADLSFPGAAGNFACALGVSISAERTPHLMMLLRRTLTDAGLATYKAKDKYQRQRPFTAANETICTPAEDAMLRKDGSYPSGHAALGWAWALVLTEVAPGRADALAQRGFAFGQSRVICGVHWQSDVNAGRIVASETVAQLHANPDFLGQLAEAKKEVAAARDNPALAKPDCALEMQSAAK